MPEIDREKCKGCRLCADACPQGAISIVDGIATIDKRLCLGCGVCVETCPNGAIKSERPLRRYPYPTPRTPYPVPRYYPRRGRWIGHRRMRRRIRRGWSS